MKLISSSKYRSMVSNQNAINSSQKRISAIKSEEAKKRADLVYKIRNLYHYMGVDIVDRQNGLENVYTEEQGEFLSLGGGALPFTGINERHNLIFKEFVVMWEKYGFGVETLTFDNLETALGQVLYCRKSIKAAIKFSIDHNKRNKPKLY